MYLELKNKFRTETGKDVFDWNEDNDVVFTQQYVDWLEKQVKLFAIPDVSVSLLERAASLVVNPGTNISGSTDIACEQWQNDYDRWRNAR